MLQRDQSKRTILYVQIPIATTQIRDKKGSRSVPSPVESKATFTPFERLPADSIKDVPSCQVFKRTAPASPSQAKTWGNVAPWEGSLCRPLPQRNESLQSRWLVRTQTEEVQHSADQLRLHFAKATMRARILGIGLWGTFKTEFSGDRH